MKIACTADWHIHQFQEFSKQLTVNWDNSCNRFIQTDTGKEMNSRLFSILQGLCDMRDYCVDHNIKYILNAGDTFHKRGNINVDTFNAAFKVIESFKIMGVVLISIAGNHDQVDSSDIPSTSIHTLNTIQTVIEQPTIVSFSGIKVAAVPYSSNKSLILNSINTLQADILMLHCGITGSVVGSGNYIMTDEYTLDELHSDKWKYIVLGHYHKPQLLAENVFYCGTPTQKSFGDEILLGDNHGKDRYNGFYTIDTDVPNSVEFIPIYEPRFITVYDQSDIPNTKDFFRIKTTESTSVQPQDNVRIEVEKEYSKPARSSVSLLDSMTTMVEKYSEENGVDFETFNLGLTILAEASMDGE